MDIVLHDFNVSHNRVFSEGAGLSVGSTRSASVVHAKLFQNTGDNVLRPGEAPTFFECLSCFGNSETFNEVETRGMINVGGNVSFVDCYFVENTFSVIVNTSAKEGINFVSFMRCLFPSQAIDPGSNFIAIETVSCMFGDQENAAIDEQYCGEPSSPFVGSSLIASGIPKPGITKGFERSETGTVSKRWIDSEKYGMTKGLVESKLIDSRLIESEKYGVSKGFIASKGIVSKEIIASKGLIASEMPGESKEFVGSKVISVNTPTFTNWRIIRGRVWIYKMGWFMFPLILQN
jgi:hypothetical protein